ncbi:type III secretion system chaperone [Vibrio sp. 10N.222.54.F12]|uniref:Type III secretion system chaperone n=2 Tax=Vibrio TaxID=662 RepID=A0ABV4KUX4_9VIBR|nr:type III secretion system chaperone [Vibrio tasmaniensis]OEF53468.1 hypothetical protein A163_03725 [Vibrio tasmaniensis 1F-267]PML15157.1 hypothetical protein BCT83_15085 [Vibrio tasmaniensis]PML45900.1 hypothetical protein BCT76_01225 [Vibrio tasmaniensis]
MLKFEAVLSELAELWGIEIPVESDAIEIIDNQESLWVLESPKQSDLFTLYTPLHVIVDQYKMSDWLSLNMQRDLLGSCWIGLNNEELCLGVSLPKDKFDHNELNNIFENMHLIKDKVHALHDCNENVHIDLALINMKFM